MPLIADCASKPGRSICFMLTAVAPFSRMDAAVKAMGATHPVNRLMFFRPGAALPPEMALLAGSGGIAALGVPRRVRKPLRAGLVGAMAWGVFALTVMPLADANALAFTCPISLTLLAIPMPGERMVGHRGSAIAPVAAEGAGRRATALPVL